VRVVSLVPSASETLLAWGIEPVAVTRFCELGDRFPTVGGTKDPMLDEIVGLAPDLVVMCDQENRREDFDALVNAGLRVHAVSILSIVDVGPQMEALAVALGADPEIGRACGVDLDPDLIDSDLHVHSVLEVDSDLHIHSDLGVDSDSHCRLRVFVPIWRKPWMTVNADTYGSSVLAASGYQNVFSAHTDRYPTVEEADIVAAKPSLVLAPSEPYPFTMRQHGELSAFAPVEFVDGKDLFWWGARTPGALTRLTRVAPNPEHGSHNRADC
jgi:hypothetical protein